MPEEPIRRQTQDVRPKAYGGLKPRSQSLPSCFVVHATPMNTPTPNGNSQILPAKVELRPVSGQDIIIAVMGATGAGKSSFINIATGKDHAAVGHDLHSCTQEVRAVACRHHDRSGRNVVFVDTPGFDDTNMTDSDVLKAIADWLTTTYEQGIKLTGLLFLHRITDNRMAGTPLRNLTMFEKLCGKGALQNVLLTTTMWDDIDEPTGSAREEELRTQYWKSMIKVGSRIARFGYTHESAWNIVDQFTGIRRPLQLQREIVDEGKELVQTAAGLTLFQWLQNLIAQFRQIIDKIEARLRDIVDPEVVTAATGEKETAEQQLRQASEQREKLRSRSKKRRLSIAAKRFMGPASRSSSPTKELELPPLPTNSALRQSCPVDSDGSHYIGSFIREEGSQKLMIIIKTLKLASDATGIIPVPGLKDAVSLALAIAESVESMRQTDASLIALARNAGEFIIAIKEQIGVGEILEDIRQAVENLVKELEQVRAVVENLKSRGRMHRCMLQAADEKVIAACSGRIILAFQLFEIKASLCTHRAIARIEAQIATRFDLPPQPR